MAEIPVGTRVVAEGPFGVFTAGSRRRDKVLLIAGGIGITPVRALLQQLHGDVVVVYRVVSAADVLFRRELDDLARASDFELHYIVGDHMTDEGRNYLSPDHLRELVPDIASRDVYVCGPPGLTDIVTRHVRQAGVRRSHIHAERFAL
jgi:ferredoxin-NADP reductase